MGDGDLTFSSRAYAKMLLHAAKFPHASVSGLLLGPSEDRLSVSDAVPLFHQAQGLSPMVEVALAQVEAACGAGRGGGGLAIRGYYHANENFRDSSVDVFSQRVADKVADNASSSSSSPVFLATVDNRRLGLAMDSHALIVSQNVDGQFKTKCSTGIALIVTS